MNRVRVLPCAISLVTVLSVVMSAQDDAARRQLLPSGALRVGLNTSNALTVAVGRELSRELGTRLGSDVVFVEYPTPGRVTDAAGLEWDIAFIAADPERTATIAFTPPYVELDATYLVAGDAPFKTSADVDRPGVKVASPATSAYTLVLRRELKQAELALLDTSSAIPALRAGTVQAIAGLRFVMLQTAAQVPGSRVIPDAFTRAQQAVAVPRNNIAALDYLVAFLNDMKRSGFVTDAIRRTGLAGASVSP